MADKIDEIIARVDADSVALNAGLIDRGEATARLDAILGGLTPAELGELQARLRARNPGISDEDVELGMFLITQGVHPAVSAKVVSEDVAAFRRIEADVSCGAITLSDGMEMMKRRHERMDDERRHAMALASVYLIELYSRRTNAAFAACAGDESGN